MTRSHALETEAAVNAFAALCVHVFLIAPRSGMNAGDVAIV